MRRLVSLVLATLIAAPSVATAQGASGYPSKPVRFITPFGAGGATDVLTRLVAAHLGQDMGRPFVVENRAGAGGNIGMEAIAKAAPDGYTIGIGGGATMAINPALYASLPFDVLRDFAPVHLLATVTHVLIVNNNVPAKNLPELIAHMKSRPGKFSNGSPGSGTTAHLYGELFKKKAGVDMTHIPYKGGNQMRADLIGGSLQLTFSTLVDAQSMIQGGSVRGIAIASSKRTPALPDLPTLTELGMPGFESEAWFGVVTPDGVARDIIAALNARIGALLVRPDFRSKLAPTGMQPASPHSPEDFGRFIAAEKKGWEQVVRESGASTF